MLRKVWSYSLVALCLFSSPAMAQSQSGAIPRRLTLKQAEDLLIQRNLSVIAARYQIDATRAARLIASYKPNPVLTVGAQQFPFYSPLAGSFTRFFSTNSDAGAQPTYTFHVDKTIERGSKRELRIAQADFQVKASEALALDAIRTQLFQLRQAFTAALLAQQNLQLVEAINHQYEQTERLTEAKVENGDIAGAELYRVQAGKLQYQQAVIQARVSYEMATRDILNLLGAKAEDVSASAIAEASSVTSGPAVQGDQQTQIDGALATAPLEISGTFDDRPIVQTLGELRQIALTERPDVIVARNNLEAATRGVQLARAQRSRDVILGFEYQRVGDDHAAGLTLQIPLFVYNNQQAAITQADAQRMSAEALLRQAELQATTDVEKAYQAYQSARRVLDLYNKQNLKPVEKLKTISDYSFKEGASSLLEFLDAQRTYNQALTAYNQARSDYQMSLWQLEQAVGRPLR
ncbi:MAG TPA: TolC family protein [Blastocatellia bacterium]|nr:TolC family protein [Blastocatellia bacterium]